MVVVCSLLPDVDVIGFGFGVAYGDPWGHRGMTHSLVFAAVLAAGLAFALPARMWGGEGTSRIRAGVVLFAATASHGLLDALTNGGLGVAFFAPFDPTRYFFPIRPLQVSPIGLGPFLSRRGLHVLQSEVLWVWLPALIVGTGGYLWRRSRHQRAAAAPAG